MYLELFDAISLIADRLEAESLLLLLLQKEDFMPTFLQCEAIDRAVARDFVLCLLRDDVKSLSKLLTQKGAESPEAIT